MNALLLSTDLLVRCTAKKSDRCAAKEYSNTACQCILFSADYHYLLLITVQIIMNTK